LCGLVVAAIVGSRGKMFELMAEAPWFTAIIALVVLVLVMIRVPLANAGHPDEPAPPTAIM